MRNTERRPGDIAGCRKRRKWCCIERALDKGRRYWGLKKA